ncbi:MAG TPA: NAD(P)-dependent alcohol dehydrogenase [Acidobacteriaceae bacterium]|nr:NAD(P)-dependent alcohol dehydrogenase [Acidobacteriaceae bacterium]
MKAFQMTRFGLEHLQPVDLPEPVPGPGDVLVRVHAASLNYRDLMLLRGHYDPKLHMPRIPLSDGAGEVTAVGKAVTRFRVGDRVAGLFFQNWQDGGPSSSKSQGALAGDLDGMLAQYVALPERGVVHFPDHLSYQEAATLPCAGVTAWRALTVASKVQPGDTVLVQGTGGVSIFALQFAKLAGARVLGTSSSDQKLARAKLLGLDAGANYKGRPDWSAWVKEQTGGLGADVVVEVGGAGTFGQSIQAVRVGGTVVQIGVLSNAEEKLSVVPLLMRQVQIAGIMVGSRAMFEAMNRAISLHGIRPVIDREFPLQEARAAYEYLEGGQHFGKVVISLG